MTRDARADAMNRTDRRNLRAFTVTTIIGMVCIGLGLWAAAHPLSDGDDGAYLLDTAPVGMVVGGLILIGFAAMGLAHRHRSGPQQPGRHTRNR